MNKQLRAMVRHTPWLFFLTIGFGVMGSVLLYFQMHLYGNIVSSVFIHHSWRDSSTVLVGIVLLFSSRGLLAWSAEKSAILMAAKNKKVLRKQLTRKLFALGPAWVMQEDKGELLTTTFEGVEQIETYLARYLPSMVLSTLIPVTLLIFLLTVDTTSTLILFMTAPLLVVFMILIGKKTAQKAKREWRALSLLSSHFHDIMQGYMTLRMFSMEKPQEDAIDAIGEAYRKTSLSTLRLAFLSSFVLELVSTLGTAIVAVFLALRLIDGHLTYADALTVLLITPEFYLPFRQLGAQFHAGQKGVAAANRIFAILALQPEAAPIEKAPLSMVHGLAMPCSIRFEHVSYHYKDSSTGIHDLTFSLPAHTSLAIIGPSGAGKSTILSLLVRFLAPTAGRILINETPLQTIDERLWLSHIAYVGQKPHLFAGTIRDNLRIVNPHATDEEIENACKMAQLHDTMLTLPDGYATMIEEAGTNLSGGQRQRLAIARAFLHPGEIVIMDEPTSSLDVFTESLLEEQVLLLKQTKTVIFAAHRIGTVSLADRVLVIDQGSLQEYGTQEELLLQRGIYHRLMNAYKEVAG